MIKNQIIEFIIRSVLSAFGMWICISLFATVNGDLGFWIFVVAGLIFSLFNAFVRPLVTMFALPLVVLTMGLFTVLINTAMVSLTIRFIPNVTMGFGGAVLSSLVMSVANGLVNYWPTPYNRR
ncbi:phage holin family protein [Candidatus Saccharibacteria bacterium]|nr:phage holin family protein [Candidatus Saccharibacteria bacterium]